MANLASATKTQRELRSAIDLAPRPGRWPFSLEKWYVDVLLPDGTVLLIYLATVTVAGFRVARVTADLYLADGQVIQGDASANQVVGGPDYLGFRGAAAIEQDHLTFRTSGLFGDLQYYPRYAPFTPRVPFLRDGHRSLTWSVEIPDADVEGDLSWPGGSTTVNGRGYRDRVWFDLLPWRMPIDTLIWGRAVTPSHAATWVRRIQGRGTIATSWIDGAARDGDGWSMAPSDVRLGRSEIFLDTNVGDIQGLRPAMLRVPLSWLSRNPHETKWRAPCVIGGENGVAVHEVATWSA